jgi:tetratricopeptide (TPR) repeat protein|tara:strand:- start:11238 stop:12299 length:1062 start_codon:yes stop_codon:yes gene_type:complete
VQDEITQHILKALNTEILGSDISTQSTENLDAHNAYLLGRFHLDRWELEQAMQFYEQAISHDPKYVDALAGLAVVHVTLIGLELHLADEHSSQARGFHERALAIDPMHVETRILSALLYYLVDQDYQRAINEIDPLIRQYPTNPDLLDYYGWMLVTLFQFERAIEVFDQGLKASPLHAVSHLDRGIALSFLGRHDEASDAYRMAEKFGYKVGWNIAYFALAQDDVDGVQAQLDRGREAWFSVQNYTLHEAIVAQMKGDRNQVKAILDSLQQESADQLGTAVIQKAMLEQNVELALSYFEQSVQKSTALSIFFRNPSGAFMAKFYAHPEYERILREAGLDDESIARLEFPPLPF